MKQLKPTDCWYCLLCEIQWVELGSNHNANGVANITHNFCFPPKGSYCKLLIGLASTIGNLAVQIQANAEVERSIHCPSARSWHSCNTSVADMVDGNGGIDLNRSLLPLLCSSAAPELPALPLSLMAEAPDLARNTACPNAVEPQLSSFQPQVWELQILLRPLEWMFFKLTPEKGLPQNTLQRCLWSFDPLHDLVTRWLLPITRNFAYY